MGKYLVPHNQKNSLFQTFDGIDNQPSFRFWPIILTIKVVYMIDQLNTINALFFSIDNNQHTIS